MKTLNAVVDDKGAVRLLEHVQLPAGQRLLVTVLDDPARTYDLARLEGCIAYSGPPVSIEEMNEAILEGGAPR